MQKLRFRLQTNLSFSTLELLEATATARITEERIHARAGEELSFQSMQS